MPEKKELTFIEALKEMEQGKITICNHGWLRKISDGKLLYQRVSGEWEETEASFAELSLWSYTLHTEHQEKPKKTWYRYTWLADFNGIHEEYKTITLNKFDVVSEQNKSTCPVLLKTESITTDSEDIKEVYQIFERGGEVKTND